MTLEEKEIIVKRIAELEQSSLNTVSKLKEIESLVLKCSLEDLLDIDDIINEKYLTD